MIRTIFITAALALAASLPIAPAQAAAARTFVSAAGSDGNNCTNVATPCRHLAAAYAATAANGEIYVLDPANYGSLTITGPVSIEGHGWASIAPVSGGNAITINANPGDAINIIGVVLDGTALTGTTGIKFNSGGSLTVQDSVVRNFGNNGIDFLPANSSSISVSTTFVGNNGGYGILVQPQGSASTTAVFERVRTQYNGANAYGISIDASSTTGTINASATDSVSSNNGGAYIAQASSQGRAILMLVRSVAANTHTGVQAGNVGAGYGIVRLTQVTITGNQDSWLAFGGIGEGVFSYGNNNIDGNSDLGPAPPLISLK
jgi:hypothetical protein